MHIYKLNNSPHQEADIDDVEIFYALDIQRSLNNGVRFMADDSDALPKFGPEELNHRV
jgi:hypothetical protein